MRRLASRKVASIHKLGVALKELRETRIWLRLCIKSDLLRPTRLSKLIDECIQLMNILGKSRVTAKANLAAAKRRKAARGNNAPPSPLGNFQSSLFTFHSSLNSDPSAGSA